MKSYVLSAVVLYVGMHLSAVAAAAAPQEGASALIADVGGIFLYSDQPDKLAQWYEDSLGVSFAAYPKIHHYMHIFRHSDKPGDLTLFSIFLAKDPLSTNRNATAISLRLNDIDAVIDRLRKKGVVVAPKTDDEFGWYSSAKDNDGNRLEFWQAKPKSKSK